MPAAPPTSAPTAARSAEGTAAPDPSTAPPARRRQHERRATTRLALLDAAASCLVDLGYAGTTTTVIVERAGVSQGALFKHFATKQELLTETAQHLYASLLQQYVERFAPLQTRR